MKIISQLIFVLLPAYIYASCCYQTTVNFRIVGDEKLTCKDFGGETVRAPPRVAMHPNYAKYFYRSCQKNVCGDGETHDKFFCGKGSCNLIGCGCEGGCIEGHPAESFLEKHGANVDSIELGIVDTIQNSIFNTKNDNADVKRGKIE